MEFVHKSVLFDEAIKALDLNENKIIVARQAAEVTAVRLQKELKE